MYCELALVRSLAGAPVLSAGLIKVRDGLVYLGGNLRGRSRLRLSIPAKSPATTSAGAFTFAKKEAARLSVNNFDFASRAAFAVLACMTNPFYPNRSSCNNQGFY
jgi:hypothetical protein